MADDGKISWSLDLDTAKAQENLKNFKDVLSQVSETESLSGIINGFIKMGPQIAIAGAAIFAFKKAFDLTLEGEQIEKINRQFNALAEDAGVDGEKLKSGLEAAAKGTVDMTDALKSANKAIIELGPNAKKIPELFDLARRAGQVYGGETTDNFEKISQAVATGNTRLLKHMGIIIDSEKAIQKFAVANNLSVNSLSAFGKQQAVLNAVLEQGNKKFKDNGDSQESLTLSLKKLTVEIKEFTESIAVMLNKAFGKDSATLVQSWTNALKQSTGFLKEQFGDGVDAATTKLNKLKMQLFELQSAREDIGKRGMVGNLLGDSAEQMDKQIEEIKRKVAAASEDLKNKMAKKEAPAAAAVGGDEAAANAALAEKSKLTKEQIENEKQLLSIRQENTNLVRETTTEEVQFTLATAAQRLNLEESFQLQLQKLDNDAATGKIARDQNYVDKRAAIEEQLQLKLQQLAQQTYEQQLMLYDNQLKAAQNVSEGIAAGFKYAAASANKDLKDYGKQGTMVFNAINTSAAGFFRGLGEGSKDSSQLMKQFMFGAIGAIADAYGQTLLAAGIGSFNPIAIAEGGALLALGALLKSMGGGTSESISGGGGGGTAAGGTNPALSTSFGPEAPTASDARKKSVSITVQGSYFETADTQRRLVDLLKQENDATDYKFTNIGVR